MANNIDHKQISKARECKSSYIHDQKEFARCFGPPKYRFIEKRQNGMRVFAFESLNGETK